MINIFVGICKTWWINEFNVPRTAASLTSVGDIFWMMIEDCCHHNHDFDCFAVGAAEWWVAKCCFICLSPFSGSFL